MSYREQMPFRTSADLLKKYRAAEQKAQMMPETEDKLLAYNEVINYCANSKFCRRDESIKRNQILFWTYNRIGDMFACRTGESYVGENKRYALEYYRNALEFTHQPREKYTTFEKIARLYLELNDEDGWRRAKEDMAAETEDALKREAYVELARSTDNPTRQAKYLEEALNFVVSENVSVIMKCKNTLRICHRLLTIYEQDGNLRDYERIRQLREKTLELMAD